MRRDEGWAELEWETARRAAQRPRCCREYIEDDNGVRSVDITTHASPLCEVHAQRFEAIEADAWGERPMMFTIDREPLWWLLFVCGSVVAGLALVALIALGVLR